MAKRSAKRARLARAASDQRLPPASTTGCFAAHSIFCSFAMSAWPGQISTGSNGGASGTATRSVSMSSGSAITTGPGRPLVAV